MMINLINVFKKKNIFIFIFLFTNSVLNAQYYDLGQDPANIKWKQIRTEHFRIIFPEQNLKQAQYLANYFESIYNKSTNTLNSKPFNIPVILHTKSVVPNAYSIWAPKRIELYTIPPQDSYGQDWLEQLAIHEFRHIIQINKINQGFSKGLYYIFGQQITASILGMYVPAWFMEGDAVCAETGLSKTGRGRIPSFEMELKAQTLNIKIFTYDKAVFGSFKDFTPNQYVLGYQLTAFARKKYGADIWNNTIDFVAKHPLGITSFSRGIKKNTGLNKSKFYHNIINELDSLWQNQQSKIVFSDSKELTAIQKYYTNYKHPHYLNDSTVIALKQGIDDITRFVTIDKQKKEKNVYTPGFLFTETFSVIDSCLVWAEISYDPRWDNRKYATIKMLDLKSGRLEIIEKKSFLFAPSLSFNKKYIAAIENNPNGESSLVIIDDMSGNVVTKTKSPENTSFFNTPSWNEENNRIALIGVSNKGKSLMIYNTETKKYSTIMDYSNEDISMPIFYKNYIIYNASYTGIENVFGIDTISKQKFQITSSIYGGKNLQISPDKKRIIYSDYSSNGFRIVESIFDEKKWIKYDTIINKSIQLYRTIAEQEKFNENDTLTLDSIYKIRKYSKIMNIFNVHSWAPLSIDAENTSIAPGFSIMSQNLLSTAFTSLGYKYNPFEKTGNYYIGFIYKGFYPVFEAKFSKGTRASTYSNDLNEEVRYVWIETKIMAGVNIPFNFSKNKYSRIIEPQINFSNTQIQQGDYAPSNFVQGTICNLNYGLLFINQIKSVEKDMHPRWAQIVEVKYANTPFKGLNLGEIYALSANFYFPGIIKHHSFKFSLAYQNKNFGTYTYSDFVTMPRGSFSLKTEEMKTIFLDYKLPLTYPDFSIPNIIYIKRIKANLFCDYMIYTYYNKTSEYKCAGIETTMDFHLFRFFAPIDAGFRITYSPLKKNLFTELLYQIKFDNL